MKVRRRDLLIFDKWTARQFADWLKNGLEKLLIGEKGTIRGFAPVEYCIKQEHTLWADLVDIHDSFSSGQQKKFQEAIVLVLAEIPTNLLYEKINLLLLEFLEAIGVKKNLNLAKPGKQMKNSKNIRLNFCKKCNNSIENGMFCNLYCKYNNIWVDDRPEKMVKIRVYRFDHDEPRIFF